MSNDLIMRRDTIENIWSLFNNTYNDATRFDAEETGLAKRILSDVQTVIDEQPTAYDVDKVARKLEENAKYFQSEADELAQVGDWGTATELQGKAAAYRDAVKTVKSGGIE